MGFLGDGLKDLITSIVTLAGLLITLALVLSLFLPLPVVAGGYLVLVLIVKLRNTRHDT